MKGVQYLIDARGKKSAVLIDLKEHGELWEDLYDRSMARNRQREPRESLSQVRKRLRRAGKQSEAL